MPQAWKEKIPGEGLREFAKNQELQLGIDLSGGTELDFIVDMSKIEEKRARGDDVSEKEVVERVRNTLEARVDPTGTKEIETVDTKYGDEWHILMQLTADVDNEATREKLQEHIALEFKKPIADPNAIITATITEKTEEVSALLEEGKNFAEITEAFVESEEVSVNIEEEKTAFADQFGEEVQNALWEAEGIVQESFPVQTIVMNPSSEQGYMMVENRAFYEVLGKEVVPRTITEEGENANDVLAELFGEDAEFEIVTIDEIPEERKDEILKNVPPNKVSEIYEEEAGSTAYQVLPATEESGTARVKIITGETSLLEELVNRSADTETETEEEQLTYNQLTIGQAPGLGQWEDTGLDGQYFRMAKVDQDQNGMPLVSISFDDEGAQRFEDLTRELVGKPMAIFIGGEFHSSPKVQEVIPGGSATISVGGENITEMRKNAQELARALNSGAIAAPVELVGENRFEATLGAESMELMKKAALIGFIVLAIYILFAYRFLGFISLLSLSLYGIAFFAIIKSFSLVMTLAGIAGVLLSFGFAVDANILIFERMREELKKGKNYSASLAIGFERAWSSIFAANMTTAIIAIILMIVGTGLVRGFATMLLIGVLLSFLGTVWITHFLLWLLVGTKVSKTKSLFIPKQ